MYIVYAENVNDAYVHGLEALMQGGEFESSRAGEVLVYPCPVTTIYEKPQQRVLFNPKRDANPTFHMMEALWMLAGRNDARWLDRFVSDFSKRFAEDDGYQHGAYGYRWRSHFDVEGAGLSRLPDQLATVIDMLKKDPNTRRAVLTMWDPVADLATDKKDLPCNLNVCFRQRRGAVDHTGDYTEDHLDMTVFCRSNDAIYGAYGANAVHFSMLQEYIAGHLGVSVGCYTQVSHNFHAYKDVLDKVGGVQELPEDLRYPASTPIGTNWSQWDHDLSSFMRLTEHSGSLGPGDHSGVYSNLWFVETAEPMYFAHNMWKQGRRQEAYDYLWKQESMSKDWQLALLGWMERRLDKAKAQGAA